MTEKILIKEMFKDDYISRVAGEKLRKIIKNSIEKKQPLTLDFAELTIASTSFFDEAIAKLKEEENISSKTFKEFVSISNLNKMDAEVLKMVTGYRRFKLS